MNKKNAAALIGLSTFLLFNFGCKPASPDILTDTVDASQAAPSPIPSPTIDPILEYEEKVRSWNGEHVILIDYSESPYDYIAEAMARIDGTYEYHLYGESANGLPIEQYKGRTGIITDFEKDPTYHRLGLVITLDEGGEKIFAGSSSYLAFFSEMTEAQGLIGKTMWVKTNMEFVKDCTLNQLHFEKMGLQNIEELTVTRAEWGTPLQPIILYLSNKDAQEGCFPFSGKFDNRFHFENETGNLVLFTEQFHLQDPKILYPDWSDDIWKMIKNREIGIGMTEEMANVACGELEVREAIMSEPGKSDLVYNCGDVRFLVKDGMVTEFIK